MNIILLTAEHGQPTGVANYYNVELPDGEVVKDAAWYYPDCKAGLSSNFTAFYGMLTGQILQEKAKNIENYVAFYKNKVEVA